VPNELFTISRTRPGTLSTMAHPPGGASLAGELTALAAAGVTVLVSLLSVGEAAKLGLSDEAQAAQAAGITFYHLPTQDRHVPDQASSLELARKLTVHLDAGDAVAMHCRYGIGRSSTLAATVLVLEDVQPRQAWDLISAARGRRVPDTAAQRDAITRIQRTPGGSYVLARPDGRGRPGLLGRLAARWRRP
jgi:protein-tyrosine phosphatase